MHFYTFLYVSPQEASGELDTRQHQDGRRTRSRSGSRCGVTFTLAKLDNIISRVIIVYTVCRQIESTLGHLCSLATVSDLLKGGGHGRVPVPDVFDIDDHGLAPEKGGVTHLALALRKGENGRGSENVDRKACLPSNLTL